MSESKQEEKKKKKVLSAIKKFSLDFTLPEERLCQHSQCFRKSQENLRRPETIWNVKRKTWRKKKAARKLNEKKTFQVGKRNENFLSANKWKCVN